jgi:hypothetical protein
VRGRKREEHILLEGEVMRRSRSLIKALEVVDAAAGGSYHTKVALRRGGGGR